MARPAILQDYGNIQNPPSDNSYQLEVMRNMQRDKELNAQMGQRKKEQADADKYRKLKMIDDATDPSKYQSPKLKSNAAVTGMLLKIKEESINDKKPIDQTYLDLQNKLLPIAQGYTTYHDNLVEQDELANEAVKVNPNLDLEKIKKDLQSHVDNEFTVTDEKGNVGFNQARIGTKSNALQEILKPENAWKYSKGTKSLIDFVKKGGEKGELFSQAPDGTQINYTTNIPEWAQLVDEKGNPLEVDPKTGLIPKGKQPKVALKGTKQDYEEIDENGRSVTKTMIVVSQPTMNKILSNDELEYAFEGDWQKHKQFSKLDVSPEHEQDLKRVYFSQWLNDNGLAQPYVSSRTHLPPQPRNTTNITNKYGNDVKTMDIVTPVKDYIKEHEGNVVTYDSKDGTRKTIGGVAQLNVFNNEITSPIIAEVKSRYPNTTGDSIYYQTIGDDTWVMKTQDAGKINPENDIVVFKLDDYSNIVGNKPQGQKAKNKSLAEAQNKMESKQGITYSWNGYDYSEDEINQAAAAEKLSKDAYLKKHGIKKK